MYSSLFEWYALFGWFIVFIALRNGHVEACSVTPFTILRCVGFLIQ